NGATLCIPTVFCSYHGEVLDRKTPLLRSLQALKKATIRLMKCFGLAEEPVKVTLGAEQEYFLIDRKFYLQRPDLVQSGRTVFGAPPPKHQQLEDHYFGAIKPRVLAFMTEVERELWKLGIPAKTRHNEAAPAQFELAPIFEELNLAVDHNMLVMEVLRMVAARNGFICLLHEKPFAGVNGSGKHNNWSICYGRRNLLDPGSNPHENAIFLTVLSAIIRAVDLHADLLRVPTSGIGQDHRLGANEAPPAIISIYLGDQLADVIDQIVKGAATSSKHPDTMRIGVDSLPVLARDATDRNRTSPFAFTGNKFEFRSMGASQSCAGCNTILNTIVADSMDYISDRLERLPRERFNAGLQATIKKIVTEHKRIIFNGDGYSKEWLAEARRRGLPNLSGTLEAIEPLRKAGNQAIFGKYNVFNVSELNSRYEVSRDEYLRRLSIEGGIALEIARSMILPVVAAEYGKAIAARQALVRVGKGQPGSKGMTAYANRLGQGLDALVEKSEALAKALPGAPQGILSAMRELRTVVDGLEGVVSDSVWPLPKYREMLFVY
ncbi:MAG: glutamine synthetase III, partial [Victivallales bacterium]|nr:glutamine synthetase III [Victivallales bacterium]